MLHGPVARKSRPAARRIHADRNAGGDLNHFDSDEPVDAGRPEGPRVGQSIELPKQPQATRPRLPELSQRLSVISLRPQVRLLGRLHLAPTSAAVRRADAGVYSALQSQ